MMPRWPTRSTGEYEMLYGSDAAIMMRESKAWMFKEVDSPLLGWEVYAAKTQFYRTPASRWWPAPASPRQPIRPRRRRRQPPPRHRSVARFGQLSRATPWT